MWVRGKRDFPAVLPPGKRPGTHCTGDWLGLGACMDGCKNLAPTGIRPSDRPARSETLYRLSYPGPQLGWIATGSLGKYVKQD